MAKKTTKLAKKAASNVKVVAKSKSNAARKTTNNPPAKHTSKKSVSKIVKQVSKPDNSSTTVSLSKLGKAKIRPKSEKETPRKIEKIVDIGQLEKKLADIMALDHTEFTVEEKLKALYVLQQIDSNIDKIRTVRGELPMEVTDREDEVAGLETRISHINTEIAESQEIGRAHV